MSGLRNIPGDPRRPAEVRRYVRAAVNPDGQAPDMLMLLGLVLGMGGLLMKIKLAAWFSLLVCISALANLNPETADFKQVVSSLTFAVMGLVSSYLQPAIRKAKEDL